MGRARQASFPSPSAEPVDPTTRRRVSALAAAVGFLMLYLGAVVWEPGQRLDDYLFGWAQQLGVGPLAVVLPLGARVVLPAAMIAVVLVCVLRSWHRGWGPLLTAGLVVLIPVLMSRGLRDFVLWRPVYGDGYGYLHNTFPSTHVTLVAALLLAVWVLLPHPPGWLAPAAALVIVLAMIGNVVGFAHRPSDALGSVLLVAACAGLVRGRS